MGLNVDKARPENLYELMGQVADAIELMPLNYHQGAWRLNEEELKNHAAVSGRDGEVCGTAYCRAGWMIALTSPKGTYLDTLEIAEKATDMLIKAGIPAKDVIYLFSGSAITQQANREGNPVPRWGTKEYTQIGSDGVRKFMFLHEERLKASRL